MATPHPDYRVLSMGFSWRRAFWNVEHGNLTNGGTCCLLQARGDLISWSTSRRVYGTFQKQILYYPSNTSTFLYLDAGTFLARLRPSSGYQYAVLN